MPTVAETLRLGFPSTLPPESRFVVIFTVYVDESGTHNDSHSVTLAAYIATPDGWERFDVEWRAALAKWELDYFHMKDFTQFRGHFKEGWDEAKRRACFSELIGIINRNVLGSVGTSFPRADYEALFSPEAHAYAGGPYGVLAAMTFLTFSDALRDVGAVGWIKYVFADGAKGKGQVLRVFDENVKNPRQREHLRLLSLEFASMQLFPPLQAADVLAYELYRELPKSLGADPAPRRYGITRLSEVPHDWARIERDELARWAEIVHVRASLNADEVARPLPMTGHRGSVVPITDAEFRERWRWWIQVRNHKVARASAYGNPDKSERGQEVPR